MKFFNKKKQLGNAKVILIDFKKLNPADFKPIHNLTKKEMCEELALCSPDGRFYINSASEGHELACKIFNILTRETYTVLSEYQKEYERRYPKIKTFDDLINIECDDEEKACAFAMLAIPLELARRGLEQAYYGY